MNAIVRHVADGEILAPGDLVRVIGRAHPLAGGRIEREVAAGLNVAEILAEVLPPAHQAAPLVVHVDGQVVPAEWWPRVRVKKGATLTFVPRLEGGNAQIWRSVLSVVLAIAAVTAAAILAPMITIAGLPLVGLALTLAKVAIAGSIMLAGTLALNALFPVRPPAIESGGGGMLNSINGAQNQANPFGPIPVVLGRHRQSPYFAAKPYTEIVGDDQWLRLLFCFGYGPLLIENLRIGETPLAAYDDYEVEILQGFEGDASPTLYPGAVSEVQLAITLENTADPANVIGGNGPWSRQTTAADADEFACDFTAAQGISAVDPDGDAVNEWRVWIGLRYRRVGDVAWIVHGGQMSFWPVQNPTRRGVRIVLPSRGQYEVEMTRLSGQGDPRFTRDEITWTALRSIQRAEPVNFPVPLALVALRIRASNQLSGVITSFNADCTSLVTAYSGSGSDWNADTASQNPADLFRHVLQGPANARPQGDAGIDLANLQEWHAYCVERGWKFNQVRNAVSSVAAALDDIAAAGRAVKTFNDGKWGVIWDRPDDPIVQHFTPRNSWGFQGQKPFVQKPHGWRVKFINEANGFTVDERVVYDDGYDEESATLFEGIEFPGVTDPGLIYKHGRFHIAQSRLRPERYVLNAGWEHLVCTRGDRVRVTHDVLLVGLASGRIKSIAGQVVTFDEQVTIAPGKTYGLHVRVPADVRVIDRAVDPATPAGEYRSLELVGDLSGISVGDLFAFGETDQESANYRILGIKSQGNLVAALTLVDDAPEVSLADAGEIPEYNPHVTIPPDPFTLPPRDLVCAEIIDGEGETLRALVRLTWQVPRFGRIAAFEVQARFEDAGQDWVRVDSVAPPRTLSDIAITGAGVWSFRVRCLFVDGTVSDWATLAHVVIEGLSAEPDDLTNLHQRTVDGQTVLDWAVIDDRRLIYYEIRKGSTWDTSLVVGPAITQPPWATTGDGAYHVRPYVLSPFGARIYSENSSSISIESSIISRNIIVERDEQATGWNGGVGLDGGVIDGGLIRTDPTGSISQPFAVAIVEQLGLEGEHIAIFVSGQIVDVGRLAECRFWTEFDAAGVLQSADFLGTSDFLGQSDVLGASPTRQIRAFPIWRFGGAEDTDVFAPADIFAEADIFTAGVTWGDWVAIASGTRVARYFQPGLVLIADAADVNAEATSFSWFVDVPDRTDDYTNLDVPDTGLSIEFYPRGYDGEPAPGAAAIAFKGGPNNAAVPHVQRAIVDGIAGDEVEITDLTLSGCTIRVLNAGVAVARAGVNLLIRGY